MRWQRARFLRMPWGIENPPHRGFVCWVRSGPPQHFANGVGYYTNIEPPGPGWGSPGVAVVPVFVELLPEFCEDPPRIAWGAWERDGRATGEGE